MIHRKLFSALLLMPAWYAPRLVAAPQASPPARGVAATSQAGKTLLASPGRQCVKAIFGVGYAAKVRWYEPLMVTYEEVTRAIKLREGAKPSKEESVAVGQTSCFDGDQKMFAQVSVIGGQNANKAIALAAGAVVGVGSAAGAAVVCVGTVGAGCPAAAAGVGLAVGAAVDMTVSQLPDAQTTFYVGSPGKLEVSGTVWSPRAVEVRQYSQGKPVSTVCGADNECGNNTCAYASSAAGSPAVCCPSGKKGLYAGYNYCYGMANGSTCWSDAMCGSGNCKGNAGGLQRGTCR